jgi:hypothetical protein
MSTLEFAVSTGSNRPTIDTVRSETAVVAVVESVAELEGVGPTELPPLADSIDPDSLDRLVRWSRTRETDGEWHVTLRYEGYDVTVRSSATIEIREADGTGSSQ